MLDIIRTPSIAANWKMNTTISEATTLARQLLDAIGSVDGVEKVICPPFVSLAAVGRIIEGSSLQLGAQNMHFEEKGAYTGEISPLMLAGLCQFAIIGHSERRQYFNETDAIVNRKVKTAIKYDIRPILCVGEKHDENENGRTSEVVSRQLESALAGIDSLNNSIIAYEPIWAIGTGRSASGEQANETIGFIRRCVAALYGTEMAANIRILYGGSVTAENIAEFIRQPEIDGALVGGASLKAEQFADIVRQTAETTGC